MRLVRAQERNKPGEAPTTRFALLTGDEKLTLLPPSWSFADALDALRRDDATEADGEATPADGWELLAPVPTPASVRDSVGFFQHIRNTRASRGDHAPLPPVWNKRPGFYFANPHSLRSATDDIAIPSGSEWFDFELEIAAVIGKAGRDLTAAEAGEAIAGYVLFCDWSARDLQAEERTMQIGLGKGKDAATSLGPWILSAREAASVRIESGLDIPVGAYVNGDLVTDPEARYTGMDWTFEEIVAYASVSVDLHPGDVIAAGTVPTGCLLETSAKEDFRGWLKPGDEVRLTAGPLGEITSRIVPGAPLADWRRT
ncbi:fumarylacetoacetate hydrolase family protein [Thermopolyspora sp. NPDC052614]|uniref:fumarylacetoacetate hydrolase family protein n=1 Tax=Thermopolyspora sp. NPDC052614 TaxID=3155682 RepID=UPI0034418B40